MYATWKIVVVAITLGSGNGGNNITIVNPTDYPYQQKEVCEKEAEKFNTKITSDNSTIVIIGKCIRESVYPE
jgi:hypothetical protein